MGASRSVTVTLNEPGKAQVGLSATKAEDPSTGKSKQIDNAKEARPSTASTTVSFYQPPSTERSETVSPTEKTENLGGGFKFGTGQYTCPSGYNLEVNYNTVTSRKYGIDSSYNYTDRKCKLGIFESTIVTPPEQITVTGAGANDLLAKGVAVTTARKEVHQGLTMAKGAAQVISADNVKLNGNNQMAVEVEVSIAKSDKGTKEVPGGKPDTEAKMKFSIAKAGTETKVEVPTAKPDETKKVKARVTCSEISEKKSGNKTSKQCEEITLEYSETTADGQQMNHTVVIDKDAKQPGTEKLFKAFNQVIKNGEAAK